MVPFAHREPFLRTVLVFFTCRGVSPLLTVVPPGIRTVFQPTCNASVVTGMTVTRRIIPLLQCHKLYFGRMYFVRLETTCWSMPTDRAIVRLEKAIHFQEITGKAVDAGVFLAYCIQQSATFLLETCTPICSCGLVGTSGPDWACSHRVSLADREVAARSAHQESAIQTCRVVCALRWSRGSASTNVDFGLLKVQ